MLAAVSSLRAKLQHGPHGALVSRLFGPGLIALVIKVATAGLSYVMFVVLAKAMSQSEYGKFAFSFNLGITLATVAGLGATTAIMRFWPQYTVTGKPELARGALFAGTRWTLYATLIVGVVIAALSPLAGGFSDDGSTTHVAMAGLMVAGFALSEYAASALRAHGNTLWSLAPRDIFWRGGVPVIAGLVMWRGGTLTASQAILVAGGLLLAITALQTAYALRVFNLRGPAQYDWPTWRAASAPMWGSAILYAMVQQFDVVITGFFLPPAETGAYFAAQKTASLLGLLLIAGNLVSAPLISAHYHAGDMAGLRRLCAFLAAGIAIPTLIGLALMAIAGNFLLSIFDHSFVSAYPVLMILSAAAAFDAIAGPTGYFMQMSGNEKTYLKIMTVTYGLTLLAQIILTPKFGMIGTALPTAVAVVAWNVWAVMVLRRRTGVDPSFIGTLAFLRQARAKGGGA